MLTSKVMLKILQARLQQYVNHELTDVQAGSISDNLENFLLASWLIMIISIVSIVIRFGKAASFFYVSCKIKLFFFFVQ